MLIDWTVPRSHHLCRGATVPVDITPALVGQNYLAIVLRIDRAAPPANRREEDAMSRDGLAAADLNRVDFGGNVEEKR